MTVIGLGSAGCNLAELFETNNEYNVKLIDVDIEGDNCYSLPQFSAYEDYETKLPDLSYFLSDTKEEVLFILSGCGKVSAASLKILSLIKNKKITILYIRPDKELISDLAKLQDRLTFSVLQEYARSGLFEKILLINNINIDSIAGDISISSYYDELNKIIYNTYKDINSLKNKKCIIDLSKDPLDISRICTYGFYDLDSDTEKLFYDFDLIDDKIYYFFINEEKLKSDNKLFKEIKEKIKNKLNKQIKVSYKIFSTPHEQSYCYVEIYSRKIQQ